jgi:hypothetical protein
MVLRETDLLMLLLLAVKRQLKTFLNIVKSPKRDLVKLKT